MVHFVPVMCDVWGELMIFRPSKCTASYMYTTGLFSKAFRSWVSSSRRIQTDGQTDRQTNCTT